MLNQLDTSDADFDVACRWLLSNEHRWTTWLPEKGKCFSQFGMYSVPWRIFMNNFLFWKLFNCAPSCCFRRKHCSAPSLWNSSQNHGNVFDLVWGSLATWSVFLAVWGPYARSKPAISKPHTCNLVLVACRNATNTFSVWLRTIFPRHLCSWCIPDVRRRKIDSCRRVKLSQLRAGLVLQAGC